MNVEFAPPRAFVSYAWEDRDHMQWVKEISVRLRVDGVELLLDQWELAPGDDLAAFMEKSVRESDAVIIACTPTYKAKSDSRAGGVGYEGSVITAELTSGAPRRKFIPLLRRGEWKDSAPSWLLGFVYLDFRGTGVELEGIYADLLATLHSQRESPPPVGSPPFPEHHVLKDSVGEPEVNQRDLDKPRADYPLVLVRMLRSGLQDPEVYELGRQWLQSNDPEDPSWPHVWNALVEAHQHDPEIVEFGRRWLLRTEATDPSWTYVWKALMDARPNDAELEELGRQWLRRA